MSAAKRVTAHLLIYTEPPVALCMPWCCSVTGNLVLGVGPRAVVLSLRRLLLSTTPRPLLLHSSRYNCRAFLALLSLLLTRACSHAHLLTFSDFCNPVLQKSER
jgi:hypothetical protein